MCLWVLWMSMLRTRPGVSGGPLEGWDCDSLEVDGTSGIVMEATHFGVKWRHWASKKENE